MVLAAHHGQRSGKEKGHKIHAMIPTRPCHVLLEGMMPLTLHAQSFIQDILLKSNFVANEKYKLFIDDGQLVPWAGLVGNDS